MSFLLRRMTLSFCTLFGLSNSQQSVQLHNKACPPLETEVSLKFSLLKMQLWGVSMVSPPHFVQPNGWHEETSVLGQSKVAHGRAVTERQMSFSGYSVNNVVLLHWWL
ncbi:hypothetical protein BDQ94DRAFT_102843 [Aspergillus welwitschiae]|uniref:Secreted protein n=1 Tax=Aspergillus welwitschiae TaxID=1341132 RepID=A0A3F3QCH4_9EURO|nr:hypothetical protein BDQ94DRAFT_102843 [Aspergillus welwitschiae]RDH36835.1 hypothetical protein BDQ94DRAFT_102843 [Aspergillus welwitschiae]